MQSSANLVSSFGEIARAKDIERDTLQLIIEDVMRAMIRKRYGADDAFEIIFNPTQGDIQILHIREVVEDWDLEDPVTQIELSEAQEIDEDFEIEDEVASEVNVMDFGRRTVQMAMQTFRQSIRDLEKEHIYDEYSKLVGEIIVGEIYQTRRREVLVMHNDVEVVLPRREQIPSDHYRKGDMLRAVVKAVLRDAGSDPQVIISRTDEVFMERLFELEVPEIYDGIVEIKKIARIPGDRAKVAVVSHDERVDPVGACVGVKGVRIHAVVRELSNENIDVLPWSDDRRQLIKNALSPASPVAVTLNETLSPPRAKVEVHADEVSQAIGRGGVNIRLASQLTEFEIDIYRDIPADEEDIEIEEFGDELSEETIAALKKIGCDTGKAVLELSVDELSRRSGLDRETARRVVDIIETEFEQGPAGGGVFPLDQPFTLEALNTANPEMEPTGADDEASAEELGDAIDEEPEVAAEGDTSVAEQVTEAQRPVAAAEADALHETDTPDGPLEDLDPEDLPDEAVVPDAAETAEASVPEPEGEGALPAGEDTGAEALAAERERAAPETAAPQAAAPEEGARAGAGAAGPGRPPGGTPTTAPAGTAEPVEEGEPFEAEADNLTPEERVEEGLTTEDEYTDDEYTDDEYTEETEKLADEERS